MIENLVRQDVKRLAVGSSWPSSEVIKSLIVDMQGMFHMCLYCPSNYGYLMSYSCLKDEHVPVSFCNI